MPDLIWQIGIGADERACAKGLQDKHGARIVKLTDEDIVDAFASLTAVDRLQIVANFSLMTGTVDTKMTPEFMAQCLVMWGLKAARVISLVICNSAVPCMKLGGKSLVNALRKSLIQAAQEEKTPLYVGALCGRVGYVNVYTKVMEDDIDVLLYFAADNRQREVGRKYVHTEASTNTKGNQFINKGSNKVTIAGISVS